MIMTELKDVIWSQNGFEDLKKHCHKNNDFLRDAASLLNERAKLEISYAENLSKIASKARKICLDTIGTLGTAWEKFITQTDLEANIHKSLGGEIIEEVSKPLKAFSDSQKEARKPAEQAVDKSVKALSEKRTKEAQAKKSSHNKAKESESLTIQLETARSKTLTEKELSRLDSKCKKAEEGVTKSDNDYISKILDAERARLELESSITSSTMIFQNLEEEKTASFKKILSTYVNILLKATPKYNECFKSLDGSVSLINVKSDLKLLIQTRGTKRQPAEQVVFSCYEEDFNNTIDSTRRKIALENKLDKLKYALQGEKNAKKGLTRLSSVYKDTPSFSTKTAQETVGFQLGHSNSVINLLEASIHRLSIPLSKLSQKPTPSHRLARFIDDRKDKQGTIYCTLRVPISENDSHIDNIEEDDTYDDCGHDYMPVNDYRRPIHQHQSSTDNDDYSDVDPDFEDDVDVAPPEYTTIDMCKVDYEYISTESDELSIKPGDVITIILRHDDGWWKGELKGKVGLFPASYVHEI